MSIETGNYSIHSDPVDIMQQDSEQEVQTKPEPQHPFIATTCYLRTSTDVHVYHVLSCILRIVTH